MEAVGSDSEVKKDLFILIKSFTEGASPKVRFTPESGHFSALAFRSAFDPKRTFDGMSGFGRGVRKRSVCYTSLTPLSIGPNPMFRSGQPPEGSSTQRRRAAP